LEEELIVPFEPIDELCEACPDIHPWLPPEIGFGLVNVADED
jgi:hypothetical protein